MKKLHPVGIDLSAKELAVTSDRHREPASRTRRPYDTTLGAFSSHLVRPPTHRSEESPDKKQEAEQDQWNAQWSAHNRERNDDADHHEHDSEDCADEPTRSVEDEGDKAPQCMEGPEKPGNASINALGHLHLRVTTL